MIKAQSGGVFLAITTHYTNEVGRSFWASFHYFNYTINLVLSFLKNCVDTITCIGLWLCCSQRLCQVRGGDHDEVSWGRVGQVYCQRQPPLRCFFFFKISFSMLSFAYRQGIRMNCIAPGPIETEVMIWTFSCFCLDSLDCFAFCLIMLGLPRYLFLPCSVILQGAFGRLDPTGEAGKTMMDQIPVVGQL